MIVVKLADGKLRRAPRRAVSLACVFDGFSTNDDFLTIELNYAFDCILGMPWLARYQPEIDWLARSVRRRVGYDVSEVFTRPTRDAITRYDLDGDLLTYAIDTFDTPRVVIRGDDDLRARLVHKYHDAPAGGHLGREKTFAALSRDFFWPRMYKWIRRWVRSCEICQRVKPVASKQAPLRPLPIATSAWRSVSMDFIFGLPCDAEGRIGVLVFVDRFNKILLQPRRK
ncbi:hypothetical protein PF005_g17295 [Phytophthora fragariae]|uniref:Integrase zinc-binding domain-containing protein n=1 Tax=Phytophthora fragariae TaxID=53985 RepID=A0A6A3E8P8_9STRA|nr:hypothetical protein PF003_g37292 [Phytophthora fragariae]KAE8930062.1 hypothetical protein PF009_g19838 [Phytophthora fragariae]KAE9059380.1 hypothetical protein PF007_g30976 [Phytophthora fragariae]KAE9120647.1 hypothetical protein PF006_g18083 [Phytophthora fragariae]KAE9169995.1 hypothetical protein PF002_g30213 [Phytophthora fragariae]